MSFVYEVSLNIYSKKYSVLLFCQNNIYNLTKKKKKDNSSCFIFSFSQ